LKRNAAVAQLYEDAIKYEGAVIADSGALINYSGKKTGRSPKDKRVVYEETSKDDVWWDLNVQMDEHTFEINREVSANAAATSASHPPQARHRLP
jgi:phosphoenolpyruvate carboxykinase (ATP)